MLQISHLSITQTKDLRTVIQDLSFTLSEPIKVAVIGEEGTGKSTLLKAICRPESICDYAHVEGQIFCDESIGYLPQMLEGTDLERSTESLIFGEADAGFDYGEYYQLLSQWGLPEALISPDRTLSSCSGGERLKLYLLKLLLDKPTMLFLDEPTGDLDLESLLFLEAFLQQTQLPVLYISHDERLLEQTADAVLHLELLRHNTEPRHTYERLPYRAYAEKKRYLFERDLRVARKAREIFDAKMERYRHVYERVQHELRTVSRGDPQTAHNLKDKMHTVKSMGRRFAREEEALPAKPIGEDPIVVKFSSVEPLHNGRTILTYHTDALCAGDRILSAPVDFTLCGQDKVAVVGPNGCGKTTWLREIAHALGQSGIPFSWMPQQYEDRMDGEASAVDWLRKTHTAEEETLIRTVLGSLCFTSEEMLRPMSTLSGGQQCKVFFAEMMLTGAPVLLLDEPTRNLSPLSAPEVRAALRDYPGAMLCVSHDRALIEEVFDTVYAFTPRGLERL